MELANALLERLDAEAEERRQLEALLAAPCDPTELAALIAHERAQIQALETRLAERTAALEAACARDVEAIERWREAHEHALRAETVTAALAALQSLGLVAEGMTLADLPDLEVQARETARELLLHATEQLQEAERTRHAARELSASAPSSLEREASRAWAVLETALTPVASSLRKPMLRDSAWALDERVLRALVRGPLTELAHDATVERELGMEGEPEEIRALSR